MRLQTFHSIAASVSVLYRRIPLLFNRQEIPINLVCCSVTHPSVSEVKNFKYSLTVNELYCIFSFITATRHDARDS